VDAVMRSALAAIVLALLAATAGADPHLVIGTKQSPPFAMKQPDGTWTGISIELWRQLADAMHVTYELREYDLDGLLAAVEHHEVDAAVSALTITAAREAKLDFTHPIYSTGLAIATKPAGGGGAFATVRALATWELAKLLAGLFGLLAAIGTLVWLFERRHNAGQFARDPVRGIGAGVWWSAVTMTTVGYGDKSPVTLGGRVIGLAWMFAALIIISFFTASITTALTVDRLESVIRGPEDLPRVSVASVAGSTSAAYLDRHHIAFRPVASPLEGLRAVASGTVDAVVYDAPILQYLAKHELGGAVHVLPQVFDRQDYGIALPDGSALREPLNRALLDALAGDRWQALLERYLGAP
jgi:polar amino acid transport system substrate-binding protein